MTQLRSDRIYQRALTAFALALPALLLIILGVLLVSALPAMGRFGPSFLWTSTWDPVAEVYGAAPMIFGTLASSLLALLIAVPLALGVAIFLTEFAPRWLRQPVAFVIELLAAIPSVVYGTWGIFVLIPFLRAHVVPPLKAVLGWTPFFHGVFYGNSLLAGGIILAIMIVPYIAAVSREVLLAVPGSQREAALAMGATRWEAVRSAVLPYGRARAAPPHHQPHHDGPGHRAVVHRGAGAVPDPRQSHHQGRIVPGLGVLHEEPGAGRPERRRRCQRHRRNGHRRRPCGDHRRAARRRRGDVSGRVRLGPAGLAGSLHRRRAQRHAVDRHRHRGLDIHRQADQPLLGRRGRGRPGDSDDPHARAYHGGDGPGRAP